MPSIAYHFTVSCVSEINGEIREGLPSLMSKPLKITAVDDEDWNTGAIIEKALGYSTAGGTARTSNITQADGQ